MCGIAGFWGNHPPELLEEMTDVLAHRGPDGRGTLILDEPRIGLGHRRLSIIDLSDRAAQPMWDADREAVIVYNGELYNYRELRAAMGSAGSDQPRFNSDSDTEVLLNLWLRRGRPAAASGHPQAPINSAHAWLNELNGMFAFALWDRASRELLLARDAFGIKPLYYTWTPRGLLFASEMKAILRSPDVDRTLDPHAIMSYMAYMYSPGERTPLLHVKKLLPGHVLRVKADGAWAIERFAPLPFSEGTERPEPSAHHAAPSLYQPSAEAAAQDVRDALSVAVERQLVADVPVGTFLSGGLDSSAVTAFASLHRQRDVDCFTITHDADMVAAEGVIEDWPYAEQVAKHLGVRLHRIHVGSDEETRLAEMIVQLDEPQPDLAALSVQHICGLARDHGVKVLLSGAGGDDVFSGYRRHFAVGLENLWSVLPRVLRGVIGSAGQVVSNQGHLGRRVAKAVRYADLPSNTRLASLFLWIDPDRLAPLFGPKMKDALAGADPRDVLIERLEELDPDMPALHKTLALERAGFLPDHNLNYTDKMSMAESVETRVPLLDPDLVSLVAALPPEYKQRGREGKWIFKKAMEPMLPRHVIYRSKSGFMAPVRRTLHQELAPLAKDILFGAAAEARGLFNPTAVKALWDLNAAGKIDASYTLLAMVCVELWIREYVD